MWCSITAGTYTSSNHRKNLRNAVDKTQEFKTEDLDIIIVPPQKRLITLDIDKPKFDALSADSACSTKDLVVSFLVTTSKSKNKHVYLELNDNNELTQPEKGLLACALGSDPKREYLSYHNFFISKDETGYCLFELKEESYKVMKWLSERKLLFSIYK